MKKNFITAVALIILFSGSSLYARGMGSGCEGSGFGPGFAKPFHHLEMIQYQFELTNSQVDRIYQIEKSYTEKFFQNRKDREKIAGLLKQHDAEIENVLTAEQKTKWNSFRKDHPMKNGRNRDNNSSGLNYDGIPGHGMLKKELNLTDEQIDRMHRVRMSYMDSFYKNRNDADKIRELRTKHDTEIESILSAEQKAKLQELKNEGPRRCGKNRQGFIYDDAE